MRYFLASKGFWLVLGAPLYYVLYQIGQVLWVRPGALGPDPAQALVTLLGEIALWMLILVLSVTPLRKVFQLLRLHGQRRAMGIACLAMLCCIGWPMRPSCWNGNGQPSGMTF